MPPRHGTRSDRSSAASRASVARSLCGDPVRKRNNVAVQVAHRELAIAVAIPIDHLVHNIRAVGLERREQRVRVGHPDIGTANTRRRRWAGCASCRPAPAASRSIRHGAACRSRAGRPRSCRSRSPARCDNTPRPWPHRRQRTVARSRGAGLPPCQTIKRMRRPAAGSRGNPSVSVNEPHMSPL